MILAYLFAARDPISRSRIGGAIEAIGWIGFAGLVLALCGCLPAADLPDPASPIGTPALVKLDGVLFEGFRAGERDVEVRASSADIDPESRVAQLRDVQIAFRDELRGAVQIRAKRARFDLAHDDFLLRGEVEGSTAAGDRFATSELRYERVSNRLWTDRPVSVWRSNLKLEAAGMDMDVTTQSLRVMGRVRTTLESR